MESNAEVKAHLARIETQAGARVAAVEQENAALRDSIEELQARFTTPGRTTSGGTARETKALDTFLRTGNDEPMRELSKKSMDMGSAAAGGALVPELIQDEIISKAIARSQLASIVRRTDASTSDYVRLLNLRGQGAAWSSETGTRSETNSLQLREIRPTHGELYSVVVTSNWLLADSKFSVTKLIMENAVDQFSKSLEAAIISGNGTNRPTGMLNSSPTTTSDSGSPARAQDVLQYIASTADLANDIYSLYFTLKPEYRRNATFVMSSASLAVIRKLRDANGSGFLWQANMGEGVDAPDGRLCGKPVITSEELSTIGGSPDVFGILCGDFNAGYEVVSIGGMSILRDPYTTKGRTAFYLSQRFGGRVVDNDSIKALSA